MQKQLRYLLIIGLGLFLSTSIRAQRPLALSLKTHPVQWFSGFRPNVNVELRFNERYALTVAFMWKTKVWNRLGGEVFPGLRKGKGLRTMIGGRYYFPKKDIAKRRDWFAEVQLRYDRKEAKFILDTQRSVAFIFGKQFNFSQRWGMDQYLGVNVYHWKKKYQKEAAKSPLRHQPVNGSGIYWQPLWGGLLNYYFE